MAETASEDLLIERKDLGPDSYTAVAKGEVIPAELAGLPRRPRAEVIRPPKTRPKRG